MAEYKRVCNFCHNDFIAQKYNTRYCCKRCASLGHKMQIKQDKQNMFNDNETYKRVLLQILTSLERIEEALLLKSTKQIIEQDELLSAEQFCKLKGIHQRTLRRMIERKEISIVKKQNKIFIPKNQTITNP